MKKYLSGIIAVLLAIGFSSFSYKHTYQKKATDGPPLYWYEIVNGELVAFLNASEDPADKVSKQEAMSNSFTLCQDEIGIDCIRGYANLQTLETTAPQTENDPDYHVIQTDD
jgi:hypothetical protein